MTYPQRDRFFAQRVTRLLAKTCAAQQIGAEAALLVTFIAATEDAKRYRGPVTFYNEQLMPLIGTRRWHTFDAARRRAVEAGWLHYEAPPTGTRTKPGTYWATIPADLESLPDTTCDEGELSTESVDGRRKASTVSVDGQHQPSTETVERSVERSVELPNLYLSLKRSSCPDSRPDAPSKPPGKQPKAPACSPEDRSTAEAIWRDIVARQPTRKPPNFDQWANDVRLMRERDKRTHEAILALWRRVQADSFWRDNVLSPAKLREKFDDLELKLKPQASRHPARVHSGDRYANVDRSCN